MTAAIRDYLQPQKAGSRLNGGCLGNSLINSHTTQLRLCSNLRGHGYRCASKCTTAVEQLAQTWLKTCTQIARVYIHKRQTNGQTHNSLLVPYPEWDIWRQKRWGWKSPWCPGAPGRGGGVKEHSIPHGKWAGRFHTLGRLIQPPAAEASLPHILGKETKCDSEGGMEDKGTEAGESLACSQTA